MLLTLSTARIFAHIKTKTGLNSLAELCNNFNTYGNIPTPNAKLTAHGPKSRNRPSNSKARSRCTCDKSTCRTIGSCSGGDCSLDPRSNQTYICAIMYK